MQIPERQVRGGAPSDGAEVGFGVELRDDHLNGDLGGLVLNRSERHSDLNLTTGWYHTWENSGQI